MCGIIGYVGSSEVVPVILDGLRRLEYRGYDSAGMAVVTEGGLEILRAAGKLRFLEQLAYQRPLHGSQGIGHTRWATHGAPTEANAHPQTDAAATVAVVHNGIVENYSELKRELLDGGVDLRSDTDTELIAQLLGREQGGLGERVLRVLRRLRGQFAVVAVHRGEPDLVVAFRQGPPLVVGLGDGENLVASDVTALLHRTRRVTYLANGDVALIRRDRVEVVDAAGKPVERPVETLDWDASRAEKGGFRHYMLKEIFEQPDAIRNTILAHLDGERTGVVLDDQGFPPARLARLRRVHLVACGTSWHAALVGKFLIEGLAGVPTEVDYASEYRYRQPLIDEATLVVGITQSGETADTLAAMELAGGRSALLGTICNVRGSSAWRLASARLLTQAGPEIGVASTKAFTTQLVALVLLAMALRSRRGLSDGTDRELLAELQRLPLHVERVLQGDRELYARGVAALCGGDSLYLGRGILYPIALEGALKLKELSYLHAEGYPAGEMKHGPIALVEEGYPVLAVALETPSRDKLLGNLREVKARGAAVLAVAEPDAAEVAEIADLVLPAPAVHPLLQPVVAVVPLQRLAYEVAVELGLDVDQPRNLAKSVTVE
ncbi:MAG TPA: glutamine--fructose-6-phosphate transaminase (isomerizing) [Thermoanaerobaculales bacterium]|nr:glutamine--fructose-6-phosphate transaminase (isomerizing) [Thermoanaerobaculales bacterium]HPA80335.1 glutamine--fructose-6-phosphate transaminase (isomerizing) [Thermoanaerobaculales bacterium]HQL28608.1 glutamine--fructose-6-phosphate transaminase (isomerizing) [Thermoanaerobaculales bacterium]HQN97358.1 glutamine--fructose-6-phosphate transaminase (isomerizing) [Thermoanaerobaculales bacterium]